MFSFFLSLGVSGLFIPARTLMRREIFLRNRHRPAAVSESQGSNEGCSGQTRQKPL
jgi:hypothetical protein